MSYFFIFYFQSDMSLNEIMTLSHTDFFFHDPCASQKQNKQKYVAYLCYNCYKQIFLQQGNYENVRTFCWNPFCSLTIEL